MMMLVYLKTNIKINANQLNQVKIRSFSFLNVAHESRLFLADLHEVGQLLELALRILVGGSIRWDLFPKKSNIYFLYGII